MWIICRRINHIHSQDEQKSTVYITRNDGAVENSYAYDALGNVLESRENIENRIRYTGQQYDQVTGQHYLRARYYNPVIGRFTQEDTYRRDGLNLYAYRRNACLNRIKTRYIRLPDLLMEYGDAVAITGQVRKIQNRYASVPLLILDEWLVSDISKDELHFLFELMERRSDSTSTVFCTQYRKEDWVKRLGRSVQAEAIVDRYAYSAYWIEMGTKICVNTARTCHSNRV